MYINGLGFVNENVFAVNNTSVSSATATDSADKTIFDTILAEETAKLNENSDKNTYKLDDIFKEAAEKYDVSYDLLKAIGYHESRFQADATSKVGAMGIMQLMPQTAEALGVTDAYDPYQNIMGAAKLLKKLSDMYDGNQNLMLAAYSAGTGNVAKYDGIPPFKETQNFVSDIAALLNQDIDVSGVTVTVNGSNSIDTSVTAKTIYSGITGAVTSTDITKLTESDKTSENELLSYEQYKLLMYYFENMLDIIKNKA
ncbi:MAG: lytic transglycosylase domain-containing protein [Wujia sp.]